jgi:hypothetical protein
MGLLSFIYWLLTGARPARRPSTNGMLRELAREKFCEKFFDAASPRCVLRPARIKILKDRRR